MKDYISSLIDLIRSVELDFNNNKFEDYSSGIEAIIKAFLHHKKEGGTLFFIGNGGSAAIASHMTIDFLKMVG